MMRRLLALPRLSAGLLWDLFAALVLLAALALAGVVAWRVFFSPPATPEAVLSPAPVAEQDDGCEEHVIAPAELRAAAVAGCKRAAARLGLRLDRDVFYRYAREGDCPSWSGACYDPKEDLIALRPGQSHDTALIHESAHALLASLSPPAWVNEALAVYAENRPPSAGDWRALARFLAEYGGFGGDGSRRIIQTERATYVLPSWHQAALVQKDAYPAALTLLGRMLFPHTPPELVAAARETGSIAEAFQRLTGTTLDAALKAAAKE